MVGRKLEQAVGMGDMAKCWDLKWGVIGRMLREGQEKWLWRKMSRYGSQ